MGMKVQCDLRTSYLEDSTATPFPSSKVPKIMGLWSYTSASTDSSGNNSQGNYTHELFCVDSSLPVQLPRTRKRKSVCHAAHDLEPIVSSRVMTTKAIFKLQSMVAETAIIKPQNENLPAE
jgi:hypothetical protein